MWSAWARGFGFLAAVCGKTFFNVLQHVVSIAHKHSPPLLFSSLHTNAQLAENLACVAKLGIQLLPQVGQCEVLVFAQTLPLELGRSNQSPPLT